MATTADDESLTSADRALVDHVRTGEMLDLAVYGPLDDAAMSAWDDTHTISATVIRDILRGRHVDDPDPHGLRLRGARVAGRLDLENISSVLELELVDCLLDGGITARDATLGALSLVGCRLSHPTEPPLDGARLTAAVVHLGRTSLDAHCREGALHLPEARLGVLNCDGVRLVNDSGPALTADGMRVERSAFLHNGSTATGSGKPGAVRVPGAEIGVQLNCSGSRLVGNSGPALVADGLQVGQDLILGYGFEATGSGEDGAIRLPGAQVGGQLTLSGARLSNASGPALTADRLRVDEYVRLDGGFAASGSGGYGAVRMLGAHVAGLDCAGARFVNDSGPALGADRLRVDEDLRLNDGFEAIGSGELGAVRMLGAHLGEFDCAGARFVNDSGPALWVDNLRVDQNTRFGDGFEASGSGEEGAIRMRGGHFGGGFILTGARLSNSSGPALSADSLRVDQNLYIGFGFEATGSGEDEVVIDLSYATVRGALVFAPDKLEHLTVPEQLVSIDGLTYTGLPLGVPPEEWLTLLRHGTPEYAAQPYQHLAAAFRAAGHDREARRVLIAQRHDQIKRRALTGRAERTWARVTGLLLGYGYKPWRALIALTAVLTAAVLAALVIGGHGALAQVRTPPPATPAPCAWIDEIGVGLDIGTPLISTGARTRCDTTDTPAGHALTLIGWALRLLAWAFATLFIAGFTGAVRKT
ncbi:hypothetical protein AB0J40_03770 [Amycolatopsis sp. NPDC049691]|uniref:hypothetical protein n=1 Tax=Amycolatopsis sp. NPDC049691 TaxID=3155155 RepID=UPI0034189D27